MNCYEAIDLMGDALEGCLALEYRAGFDEHLEECPPCHTYLDQLSLTLQSLERLPRASVSSQQRSELIATFQRERRKN